LLGLGLGFELGFGFGIRFGVHLAARGLDAEGPPRLAHGKPEGRDCGAPVAALAALAARLRERSDGRPPIGRAGAVAEEGHPDGLYRRGLQPAVVRVALVPG